MHSLNTGMAHVSMCLGADQFYHYVERFGFGHRLGVDMEGEAAGAVRKRGDPEWHESDLGTNAFGQGLAVTPLQMVSAVGAIANRGYMMRPYVVSQMIDAGETAVNALPGESTVRRASGGRRHGHWPTERRSRTWRLDRSGFARGRNDADAPIRRGMRWATMSA